MSIKGTRATTKNLSTLIECSENGDDASSLMLAPENVENQGSSEGRCSAYETASSKFSTNGEDTVVECTCRDPIPNESTNASSKHIRNLSDTTSKSRSEASPKNHKRKRSSASSAISFNGSSSDYPLSSSSTYHSTNPAVKKSFSFRTLLNNFTAPVRGGKQEKQFGGSTSQNNDSSDPTSINNQHVVAKQEKSSQSSSVSKKLEFVEAKESLSAMTNVEPESSRQLSNDFVQIPTNIDHFRRNYMESILNSMQDDPSQSQNIEECIECQVCFSLRPLAQFPTLINCSHRPCRTCLEVYLKIEIMENRVLVSCPECSEPLHPTDIYTILCMHHQLLLSYERFMVRRVLMLDADTRWCPGPDCDYAVIANSCAACPKLECERPECGTLFCYHCKGEWHSNMTCDEARGKSMERMFASAASALNRSGSIAELIGAASSSSNEPFKPSDLKACPRCHTLIVKMNDGSCNHMICPMCSADFCWLCLKEISDLHYLSPTGCTFWGKKPWTKKKKLLWQIGTLIGAPVGIALIAGLAVPGIICGVPIFVGRKVYQRFAASSKARRRLLTIAGVSGSLVVSPVLAVLAVGVGVPIMLAYVYGVVPLSLCRNGGCGGSNESTTLENFVEDEQELGIVASGLRVYDDEEQARLLRKQFSDIEKMDRSSMATRVSTNSGFSLNGASTSAAGSSGRAYGSHGHPNQADVLSSSSAKINLMVDQRKRKMSAESCANREDGSIIGQAGSHYHFDNKSVHTVCSGGTEAQSYCCENEENSSIKAMSGSIDGKSLGDSASVRFARQCRANSRPERDLSPSSIYSLNDQQPIGARLPPRVNNVSTVPCQQTSTPAFLSTNSQMPGSSNIEASSDERDPFRVRTLLDNLRQILNDDDEEGGVPSTGKPQKKRPSPSNPKQQHHKSSASVGAAGSRVAAKIQYDNHQRALSVQIPATTSQLRRSMPSLTPQPNPVPTSLTSSGTVLVESTAVTIDPLNEKSETKNRRRRFVNFFRRTPNEKPENP